MFLKMFKEIEVVTEKISETNVTLIRSKGCYRVRIKNLSTGTIFVNGCPIENRETENFYITGGVFKNDMELNVSETTSHVEVYVTRYLDPFC